MDSLTMFDLVFTNKKSKSYKQALDSLSRINDIVSNITMDFPDVSSIEIETRKNKWVSLSEEVAKGVHTMGLHLDEDYRSLLIHFQKDSTMKPHFHSKEWEILMVVEGEAKDISTDTILKRGDVYIIPRNAVHHLVTTTKECYMYVMFSSNKHNLKISDSDKEIAKRLIGKKHSFKA